MYALKHIIYIAILTNIFGPIIFFTKSIKRKCLLHYTLKLFQGQKCHKQHKSKTRANAPV